MEGLYWPARLQLEFLGGGRLIIFFFSFSTTTAKGLPSLKVEDRRQQQQNTKIFQGETQLTYKHIRTSSRRMLFFSFGEGIYYSRTLPRASIIKIRRKTKQNFSQLSKKKMGNKCIFISYLMSSCAPYCSAASCMWISLLQERHWESGSYLENRGGGGGETTIRNLFVFFFFQKIKQMFE